MLSEVYSVSSKRRLTESVSMGKDASSSTLLHIVLFSLSIPLLSGKTEPKVHRSTVYDFEVGQDSG